MNFINDYIIIYKGKKYKTINEVLSQNNKYNVNEEFIVPDLQGIIIRKNEKEIKKTSGIW